MYIVRMQTLKTPMKEYIFNNPEMAQAFYDGVKKMWNMANIVTLELVTEE